MRIVKEEIREVLFNYLTEHPEDAPYFLNVVSDSMKNYERKIAIQRHKRMTDAFNILSSFILDSKSFRRLSLKYQYVFLIDTMFLMFPKSKVTGHSQAEKDLFDMFCYIVKENLPLDYEWMLEAKGKEIVEWMKELIRVNEL